MAKQLLREPPAKSAGDDLYRRDFYSWCLREVALLREGRFDAIDLANIVEEIESLGNEQEHALESSLRVLLVHLLKWRYQAQRRTRSWAGSIARERVNYGRRLLRNPGLKPQQPQLFADAYRDACKVAAAETGLPRDTFPADCPFTLDQALDEDFLPGPETAA